MPPHRCCLACRQVRPLWFCASTFQIVRPPSIQDSSLPPSPSPDPQNSPSPSPASAPFHAPACAARSHGAGRSRQWHGTCRSRGRGARWRRPPVSPLLSRPTEQLHQTRRHAASMDDRHPIQPSPWFCTAPTSTRSRSPASAPSYATPRHSAPASHPLAGPGRGGGG